MSRDHPTEIVDTLWSRIQAEVPKFNPIIANGIVTKHFEQAEKYIDSVFINASKSFPEGLVYKGYRRCSPLEEAGEILKMKSRRTIELTRSSVYMLYYFFEHEGEPLPAKPMWLPYLDQAGQFYLRGTLFTMSPVLIDEGLSVSGQSIFIGFLKGKVTFNRTAISYYLNDTLINTYYIHAKIHNINHKKIPHYADDKDHRIKMPHVTALYLFGKFGLKGTFKKFLDVDIEISDTGFPEDQYPRSEWGIVRSCGIQPKTVRSGWTPNDLQIAFPLDKWSQGMDGLLAAFFCISDHYRHRLDPEWTESTAVWRIILAHAIFLASYGDGKLKEEADRHFVSIDHYLDNLLQSSLRYTGVDCEDIYDLFFYLIENLVKIVINKDVGSLYGKRLTILRYALSNIVEGINTFIFNITGNKRKNLQKKDIARELGRCLQVDTFFKTQKLGSKHNEINAIQNPGDNIMFVHTLKIIPQEKATQKSSGKNAVNLNQPSALYHPSLNEIMAVAYTPKSDPTSRSVLNPYQITGTDGLIKPNPAFKDLLDDVRRKL